jgi:hypothetical protein
MGPISEDDQCPVRNSNRETHKREHRALPLSQPARSGPIPKVYEDNDV